VVETPRGFDVHDLRRERPDAGAVALPFPVREPGARLLYFTDPHSCHERYPQLLATIDAWVDDATVIVLGGDLFEGSDPLARRSRGSLDWEFLAALRSRAPVVWNLGNHDADLGDGGFAGTVDRARALGIIVISDLVEQGSGRAIAEPEAMVAAGGLWLTFAGLAPAAAEVYPKQVASEVEARGLPPGPGGPRVVVSHRGFPADQALLAGLAPGTLVLGGHDHVSRAVSGPVGYRQGGAFGEDLVVARCRPAGCAVERAPELDARGDPEFARRLCEHRRRYLSASDLEVVGHLSRALALEAAAAWAVLAVRAATQAEVAVLNHTSFGGGLDGGKVTRHALDRFARFDNPLWVAEVEGETLAEVLAFATKSRTGDAAAASGDFVHVSPVRPVAGRRYRLVANSWVVEHARAYLGADPGPFRPLAGWTVRAALLRGLGR